jgi:DNA-binding GntR family transcriptional regulator
MKRQTRSTTPARIGRPRSPAKASASTARTRAEAVRSARVPRPGLSEQARARLEEMIVSLELAPGSIWSEAELSAKLGIGRTPVREALQRLEGDHLVRILRRHGAQITEINVVE